MIRGAYVRCASLLTAALIALPLFDAQEAIPKTIQLPDGTPVHLYLQDDLDSKSSRKGDLIRFQVREDVVVRNVVVIPAGSGAQGHVTGVGHRSMAGHSGRLSFAVDYVTAPDGAKVPVVSAPNLSGGSNGKVAAAAAATYGPGALLMRGWNADIRKGTMLNAYVSGDHEIAMANLTTHPSYSLSSAKPSSQSVTPPPPPATSTLASLIIGSTPTGADVEMDGELVGSTPCTVAVIPGNHRISIKKKGFTDWIYSLDVANGTVHLNAVLSPASPQ